jgi:hypothetical protein
LYFLPLPQGQGAFLDGADCIRDTPGLVVSVLAWETVIADFITRQADRLRIHTAGT